MTGTEQHTQLTGGTAGIVLLGLLYGTNLGQIRHCISSMLTQHMCSLPVIEACCRSDDRSCSASLAEQLLGEFNPSQVDGEYIPAPMTMD